MCIRDSKGAKSRQGGSYMNYTQLTKEKKAQIDILLKQGMSKMCIRDRLERVSV